MNLHGQAAFCKEAMRIRNSWYPDYIDREGLIAAIADGLHTLEDPESAEGDMRDGIHLIARVLQFVESSAEAALEAFHRQRRMFIILGDLFNIHVEETDMDHKRWMDSLDLGSSFDDAIRGFVDSTGIYAYKGPSWDLTREEEAHFKTYLPSIYQATKPELSIEVWAGAIPGIPGYRWPGRRKLGKLSEIMIG